LGWPEKQTDEETHRRRDGGRDELEGGTKDGVSVGEQFSSLGPGEETIKEGGCGGTVC